MPCYDGRPTVVYESGISPDDLNNANQCVRKLEAALCSICNELDRRGITESVLFEAGRNGEIDLIQIYNAHKKEDAARLANDISRRYSSDELALIKKLISAR